MDPHCSVHKLRPTPRQLRLLSIYGKALEAKQIYAYTVYIYIHSNYMYTKAMKFIKITMRKKHVFALAFSAGNLMEIVPLENLLL